MAGTIFGAAQSTCTQRIFVVAYENNLDLTLSPVNFATGEHKKEPHISRQPFGQVPTLESADGLKLFESRAIARYLDIKAGGKLTHFKDLNTYAQVETWISVETSNFDKHASVLVYELLFKGMFGQKVDEVEVAKRKTAIEPILDVYEKELSKRKFLVGNELTIADLFHLPYGTHLFRLLPDLLESRPNLKKWFTTLTNLPSWQKTLQLK